MKQHAQHGIESLRDKYRHVYGCITCQQRGIGDKMGVLKNVQYQDEVQQKGNKQVMYYYATEQIPASVGRFDGVQCFVTDPKRVQFLSEDAKQSVLKRVSKIGGKLIVHGSYQIGTLSKQWQRSLLKHEIGICAQVGAEMYVLHFEEKSGFKAKLGECLVGLDRGKTHLLLENSSKRIKNKKRYLQDILWAAKQYCDGVVIDTAHLYSSGMSATAKEMFLVLKTIKSNNQLKLLHFNDQQGQFGRGKDIHGTLLRGKCFGDPANFIPFIDICNMMKEYEIPVVFEFAADANDVLNVFKQTSEIVLNRNDIPDLLGYVKQIASRKSQFQQIYKYKQLAKQLIDVYYKGDGNFPLTLNSDKWKQYAFDPYIGNLLQLYKQWYAFVPLNKQIQIPMLLNRQDVEHIIEDLKQEEMLQGEFLVCGSYRRGNKFGIGDIDIAVKDSPQLRQRLTSNSKYIASVQGKQIIRLTHIYKKTEETMNVSIDIYIYTTVFERTILTVFLTGSQYFNIFLRHRAKQLGYTLGNWQIYKGTEQVKVGNEEQLFALLKLKVVPVQFRNFAQDALNYYSIPDS